MCVRMCMCVCMCMCVYIYVSVYVRKLYSSTRLQVQYLIVVTQVQGEAEEIGDNQDIYECSGI